MPIKNSRNSKSKSTVTLTGNGAFGTAEGIRTPDLLVRSQTLYPTELQPHTVHFQTKAYLY